MGTCWWPAVRTRSHQGSLSDAELYDPSTGTFTRTGSLNVARAFATGALLPDGDVLVAGGLSNVPSALLERRALRSGHPELEPDDAHERTRGTGSRPPSSPTGTCWSPGSALTQPPEVYDPVDATWTDTGPLPVANEDATATLLGNGDVLVAGGDTTAAALYDPATNDWSATGSMAAVAGGPDGDPARQRRCARGRAARTPTSSRRSRPPRCTTRPRRRGRCPNGQMSVPREGQAAVELPDGNALVVGGCTAECDSGQITATAEEFDAQGGYWFCVGSMTQARARPVGDACSATATCWWPAAATTAASTSPARICTPLDLGVGPPDQRPVGRRVTLNGRGFFAFEPVVVTWRFSKIATRQDRRRRRLRREAHGPVGPPGPGHDRGRGPEELQPPPRRASR